MSFLNRVEGFLQRFAIPGLIRYVVVFNALVFILILLEPGYEQALTLDASKVLQGQVWRLVTYIFIPDIRQPFLLVFALLVLWSIGDHLEGAWGSFKLNLFYLTGMVGCTVAALIYGPVDSNFYLNSSLFFAFATLFPNFQFLLFFIIPVKVKWLGFFSAGLLALAFVASPLAGKAAMIACLANYLIFFGPPVAISIFQKRKIAERRQRFESQKVRAGEALHCCVVCGRTEISNPELDFRVCDDGQEYCNEHMPKAAQS